MDQIMHRTARLMAYLGGVVLIALIVITCASIVGRSLNTIAHGPFASEHLTWLAQFLIDKGVGPVPGDFELLEAGIAFAVFSFLPWCQMNNGHATVDLFTSRFGPGINRLIDLITAILMAVVFAIIAWRLSVAMDDKMRYGETTFILQFPIWWSYALSAAAATVAAVTSFWMVRVRLRALAGSNDNEASGTGASKEVAN
jgi:TRAP-type C4-dicarboxylate transport system permease small subunit